MDEGYRVTVDGVMSERFCRGFPGLSRGVDAGRTTLSAGSPGAPILGDLLLALGNLGLVVVRVEQLHDTPHSPLEA